VSDRVELEKAVVGRAAAALVEDGMLLGLGTGSTVGHLLPALAQRGLQDVRCVSTSPRTEAAARALGLSVEPFDPIARLDMAIDGADQVAPDGWLVKGGGAAHTREKIVALAADSFVVIISSEKDVERLTPPVPLELLRFGLAATPRCPRARRPARGDAGQPDGGVIADYTGPVGDRSALASRLDAIPGVVSHGLFTPASVAEVLIARGDDVERRAVSAGSR
jgi:ribose 5-phosphate isomerase A